MLALAAVSGCGGDEPSSRARTATTPSLFVHCAGSGIPTVVLEGGGAGLAEQWQDVQPQLARTTRVCAYDRAGAGHNPVTHGSRDARDEIADLRRLLASRRIEPPYVVVGHSYGGVLARIFADQNPSRTAGLVLVDTMGRDGRRRQLDIWPESQAPGIRELLATTVLGNVDLSVGEAIASRVTDFGDMPLAVIDAGRETNFATLPAATRRRLEGLWSRMHDELARLSDDSVRVTALRSEHDVASPTQGQPAVVIRAVQAVVRAVREQSRLPACSEIFSGRDVRCHR